MLYSNPFVHTYPVAYRLSRKNSPCASSRVVVSGVSYIMVSIVAFGVLNPRQEWNGARLFDDLIRLYANPASDGHWSHDIRDLASSVFVFD